MAKLAAAGVPEAQTLTAEKAIDYDGMRIGFGGDLKAVGLLESAAAVNVLDRR